MNKNSILDLEAQQDIFENLTPQQSLNENLSRLNNFNSIEDEANIYFHSYDPCMENSIIGVKKNNKNPYFFLEDDVSVLSSDYASNLGSGIDEKGFLKKTSSILNFDSQDIAISAETAHETPKNKCK